MPHDEAQVIGLRLAHPREMFEVPLADVFSEYHSFLPGVDICMSHLHSHPSRAPVRVEVELPPAETGPEVAQRISRTLERYCDHRLAYNLRERRGTVFDGLASLRVGLPVVFIGFLLVVLAPGGGNGGTGNAGLVLDTGGWVLVWVGLWFPLDSLLFTPLGYGRENRALDRLRRAEVVVSAR